jgi:hypothetical protein
MVHGALHPLPEEMVQAPRQTDRAGKNFPKKLL